MYIEFRVMDFIIWYRIPSYRFYVECDFVVFVKTSEYKRKPTSKNGYIIFFL